MLATRESSPQPRPRRALLGATILSIASTVVACPVDDPHIHDEGPFAVEVVSFEPGPGAGFGQDAMPDIVLGPPTGGVTSAGSTDVVSLGLGGSIVLRLGHAATDGDGPDLRIFENPFEVPCDDDDCPRVFSEPGEVSVSDDGETFTAFPCTPPDGCAGYGVVIAGTENGIDATSADAGGDAFDLSDVGLSAAQFVRITDRGDDDAGTSAGFDLDAIAAVH